MWHPARANLYLVLQDPLVQVLLWILECTRPESRGLPSGGHQTWLRNPLSMGIYMGKSTYNHDELSIATCDFSEISRISGHETPVPHDSMPPSSPLLVRLGVVINDG